MIDNKDYLMEYKEKLEDDPKHSIWMEAYVVGKISAYRDGYRLLKELHDKHTHLRKEMYREETIFRAKRDKIEKTKIKN